MAIPTSPTVVVLEKDNSIYAPNIDSSIVGVLGFADKGPTNKATLITSQNQLINTFGKPDSSIPGQGLEGALEILESTSRVYFTRAAQSTALQASAAVSIGFSPAVLLTDTGAAFNSTTLYYAAYNNAGTLDSSATLTIASATGYTTANQNILRVLDEDLNSSPIYAKQDTAGNVYIASRFAGSGASLVVSGPGTFLTFGILDPSGNAGVAAANVTASGGTAINDPTNTSSLYCLANSIYTGKGYNLSSLRDGTAVGLSVEVDSKSQFDKFTINSEGAQVENFTVLLSPSSPYSIDYLLNTDINLNNSEYVNTQILASGTAFTIPNNQADVLGSSRNFNYQGSVTFATPRFVKLIEGTYGLAGGNSGYSTTEIGTTDDATALIGTAASKTGMYAFDDDSLNISLAVIPGITNQSVINAFITLAETSQNFVAITAPPLGLNTAQEAVDWMNGAFSTRTAPINSSYAAVYWPWVQVFNYFAGADQWYDPAIFAARQYVYTDNVRDPWWAPAGYSRGRLLKPSDVEVRLNLGDRNSLYENNVNPVIKETQGGIIIFGQKTAQRLSSSLESVNVRRLMIYMRKVLLELGKPFQFEPNDEFTWELVEDRINPFLDDLINRRAIVEGAVKCDSDTNTPLRVDRKELWCQITIKPTLAAETVVFEVNLTSQAATING